MYILHCPECRFNLSQLIDRSLCKPADVLGIEMPIDFALTLKAKYVSTTQNRRLVCSQIIDILTFLIK